MLLPLSRICASLVSRFEPSGRYCLLFFRRDAVCILVLSGFA